MNADELANLRAVVAEYKRLQIVARKYLLIGRVALTVSLAAIALTLIGMFALIPAALIGHGLVAAAWTALAGLVLSLISALVHAVAVCLGTQANEKSVELQEQTVTEVVAVIAPKTGP